MSSRSDSTGHRFFRAMVLMGSSLAVGCGGQTIQESSSSSNGGSGGSAGPKGESGSGGKGGQSGAGTITGSSGTLVVTVPGTGGSGPITVDPGPFACSPAQWDCSATMVSCDYRTGVGFTLPDGCRCDEARPKSPTDCAPGTTFVCRNATILSGGQILSQSVPFECTCTPRMSNCYEMCDKAFQPFAGFTCVGGPSDAGLDAILCGCAPVLLK
jgi:hypothetical protein